MRDPESTGSAEREDASNGDHAGELDEWVAAPERTREPAATTEAVEVKPAGIEPDDEPIEVESASSTGVEDPRPPSARRDRGQSPRERWLAGRLRRAKEKVSAQDEAIDELKARVAALESDLKRAHRGSNPRPAKEAPADKPKPPKPKAKPKAIRKTRGRDAGLDLNSASFEELRKLGLSITQSARLIAYRDTRGGFKSLDDVAAVPGFSRDTIRDLSTKARV